MKNYQLLALFFLLPCICIAQISFEQIEGLPDFNIGNMAVSPIGEYFVQARNDQSAIYHSMDGETWSKALLPKNLSMYDMAFLDDGTPIFKSERSEHLIRRNGEWHLLSFKSGWSSPGASFAKGDTLFVYHENAFGYTIDKGLSFETLFTASETIIDHTAEIWKLEDHFVLHHTAGASDMISTYNREGTLLSFEGINNHVRGVLYNPCGQILIFGTSNYALIKGDGLDMEQGLLTSISSSFQYDSEIAIHGHDYYLKNENLIWKSDGCDFTWTKVIENDLVYNHEELYISLAGELYVFNEYRNHTYKALLSDIPNEVSFNRVDFDIDYAFVHSVNETKKGMQFSLSTNNSYKKDVGVDLWSEFIEDELNSNVFHFSPNGNMYIHKDGSLMFSDDSGASLSPIALPTQNLNFGFDFYVLDDDVLFINSVFDGAFYTFDNGTSWHLVEGFFNIDRLETKIVGNKIILAELNYSHTVIEIDISTGQSETYELNPLFSSIIGKGSAILDDGMIYFIADDFSDNLPEGVWSYKIGEEAIFVDDLSLLTNPIRMISSGNELYIVGTNDYLLYNGLDFDLYPFEGLVSNSYKQFIVSSNQYLYAIEGNHEIYRSTIPLSTDHYIKGDIIFDENQDCEIETTDAELDFWKVKVTGDNYLRIRTTNNEKGYSFNVPVGEYSVRAIPANTDWDVCDNDFQIAITKDDYEVTKDFVAQSNSDCAHLELDFSTPFLRRCFDNFYSVSIKNTGSVSSSNAILTINTDPYFDFLSIDENLNYSQISDQELRIEIEPLGLNEEIKFRIYFTLSCSAELGQEHCMLGVLDTENICENPGRLYTECQENIGSYDPNDKRSFSEEGKEIDRVDKDEFIYYHIRFQNTGTDTAFTVRVEDQLSSYLDVSTLEMLSASHPYTFMITDGPSLNVEFENIMLPDSTTNELLSHGYFKCKIKPIADLPYGTIIPNEAAIYFDFNEPVITDENLVSILPPNVVDEVAQGIPFTIVPNPSTDYITIETPLNESIELLQVDIINMEGRVIQTIEKGSPKKMDITHIPAGLYYIRLTADDRIWSAKKFVKM